MTTLFHSTVESLRARGVSIPDDVDRALQLITANAEVRKTNDGASLVDGAYASGELTPANLLGKLTELSVLQFLRSLDQVRADEIDRQSAAVARDREILLWREKITEHEIAAEAARQGGYGLSQNLVEPEDLEI